MFRESRLARMSDGHYCIVKDLGPVKGGKGMRHHEVIVDLTPRGIILFLRRVLVRPDPSEPELPPYRLGTRERAIEPRSFELPATKGR
jgi:hypothetical protein